MKGVIWRLPFCIFTMNLEIKVMLLKNAIEFARKNEKNLNYNSIVYKVYEQDELIYVGIGGKGKRKGSGRLAEHKSESLYSSFRFQYYMDKWDLGYTRAQANEMWNNLDWGLIQFYEIEDADLKETELISTFSPKYNRDKKQLV